MVNKKLRIYNKDGSINKEITNFCHENLVIQNIKNALMKEFIPICPIWDLSNRIDDMFENQCKTNVYSHLDKYKDVNVISESDLCHMCMMSIIGNIRLIRMKIYNLCIDQIYYEKDDSSLESSNDVNDIKDTSIPVIE